VGKAIKYCTNLSFFFLERRDTGEKGTYWFNFKFEIFYSGSEISVAASKVTIGP